MRVYTAHTSDHAAPVLVREGFSWGAFLYPLEYLYTSNQMVLTVGIISDLIRGDVFQWGKIMAACLLASLPPIVIYAFLMDYYVAGLTAGATKG